MGVFRPIGYYDDVIKAEGEHHSARSCVELLVSCFGPIGIWTQTLVEVSAMQVNQVVAFFDYLLSDQPGCAFGLRAVRIARIKAVHALAVNGIYVRHFLLEGSKIHERNDDQLS